MWKVVVVVVVMRVVAEMNATVERKLDVDEILPVMN